MANFTETGTVFNLQKFSLHDGPGIRTVVFFKGCPLRCQWCSNPESQSGSIQILWDREKCLGCGACVQACPRGAVRLASGVEMDPKKCTACGICVRGCPGRALKAEGEIRTVASVLEECLQDAAFYEGSGGGVTLSGGEPLAQPAFALALLKALRQKGVSTAMETTGCAPSEIFREACGLLDLLLFDIKHWDEARHRKGTGVSGALPLENLRAALADNRPVLPRIPVIPGYNDSIRDAQGFVRLLKDIGAEEVQLLPFHQFGERKYALLGRKYPYAGVSPLHEESLTGYRQEFLQNGIRAFF